MKKAFSVMLSVLIVVSIIGTVAAAEKKPKVIQRSGEVVAIDVAAKSMTIKPIKYKDNIVVTINEKTLVKMDKEKKSLTDIRVGDSVTIWIFEKDNIAKSIDIKTAKADKKGAEPAKPVEPSKPAKK
ncbi:MAG: hypothetical protein M0Z70_06915 [Nitrospiraceae bacterium]|jgi:PDZ domain-containing secreted protein|nr:hypothetical protein [Nitrospiraceae bacterium]